MSKAQIKSYAKLNLALHVIGKNSLLHRIETIVAFISFHDEIFIKKIKSNKHSISFTGKFSHNISRNNTISKLLKILEKKELIYRYVSSKTKLKFRFLPICMQFLNIKTNSIKIQLEIH